jgi:hypothetical protein
MDPKMDPKAYENFKSDLQMELPSHSIGTSEEYLAQKHKRTSRSQLPNICVSEI